MINFSRVPSPAPPTQTTEWALFLAPLIVIGGLLLLTLVRSGVKQFIADRPTPTPAIRPGIVSLAFSPDGRSLVSANRSGTVQTWNAASGIRHQTIRHPLFSRGRWFSETKGLAFSPDGRLLAGIYQASLWLWKWPSGKLIRTFPLKDPLLSSVAFSPDSQWVAVSSRADSSFAANSGAVRLLKVKTGQWQGVLKDKLLDMGSIAFSPDGQRLAASAVGIRGKNLAHRNLIVQWNLRTRQREWEVWRDNGEGDVAYSPDGKRLAVGGALPYVLLDSRSGKLAVTMQPDPCYHAHIAFSQRHQILIGSGDYTPLAFRDTTTGKAVKPAPNSKLYDGSSLAFSRDENRLAIGDHTGLIEIWDTYQLGSPQRRMQLLMTIDTLQDTVVIPPATPAPRN